MSEPTTDDLRGYYLALKHRFDGDTAPRRDELVVSSMRSEAQVVFTDVERDVKEIYRRAGNRLAYMIAKMDATPPPTTGE